MLNNICSTGTGRPSLLAGLHLPPSGGGSDDSADILDSVAAAGVPPRPRRLWKVNDNALKAVPFFYPPLDPRCTIFVSDAPPSVVAVRIAECLRKRSISTEYDEEAVRQRVSLVESRIARLTRRLYYLTQYSFVSFSFQ